jgi:peptidyl-dipeptidase Dcp
MRQQLAEIDAIANQKDPPTLENTIIAMEKSGAMLTRVNRVFNAITAANLNDALEKVRDEISPKLAAHSDAIFMNEKLFARVKAIYFAKPKAGSNTHLRAHETTLQLV